ncbi:hypothetical protein [Cerasicoccus frondis]|uniref:hypothetical protein n=1 Tax=Cerasicoccus frondis TaxID=490090 RepID=UPI0028527852|nr:hypothetical protein [Cerasicoccus frondis]
MKNKTSIILALISFGIIGLFAGCEKDAGDHLEDAGESISDAAESAGDSISDAAEDASDEVKDATN